jgi:glycosyltransferase involved in cell wall biosynthesis
LSTNRYSALRLKVCQIIPTLVQGGAEKQMALLATHLDPERFESHVIVLTHSGPLEDELRSEGVHVHLIGKSGKADPRAYLRLKRTLKNIAPDVVHTWLFAANSYGRFAAHRAGVPTIIAGERCVDPWKTRWHFMVDRYLQKYTACIATNTNAVTNFYSQHGLDRSKFLVIPNAVIPSHEVPLSRAQLFERLRIPPRGRVVGAIGRLWKQKGYRDLIWSAELLRVAYQDVWFVIVGDGPEMQKLQLIRDQYEAQDAVRFVGHRGDAGQLLSAFDVLWNGSLYEGQSNTILEAMSCGVPVIASDIPGNRDLVIEDQTGYLIPLGDPARLAKTTNNLLRDPARLQRLGDHARQLVAVDFSLEKMVRSYEQLYEHHAARTR